MQINKIKKVLLLSCGYCENNLKHMFVGFKSKKLTFPANVLCIEHVEHGFILFDTGYSDLIYKNGIVSKIYNLFNPTTVEKKDYITSQLEQHNISSDEVKYIILSHCHPDHIGGLCFFEQAELRLSQESYHELKDGKGLVFKNMKEEFVQKSKILTQETQHPILSNYFSKVYDVFDDASIFAVDLSGHTNGQLGIYIPEEELFMAADASWGADFVGLTEKMKLIPRLIQSDYQQYAQTSQVLQKFIAQETQIDVLFSHSNRTLKKD